MYNFIKILDTMLANYINLLNKLYKNNKFYLLLLLYATYNILSTLLTLLFRKKVDLTTNWLKDARKKYGIKEHPPPFINTKIPPGFNGGGWYGYGADFDTQEYKNIPLRGNHDRDKEGTRMMRGWWPEFNWLEYPGTKYKNKVYRRADQDITRILYNNRGEILSLICPQFGICLPHLGCIRVEVTVTHVKGWINEINKKCRGNAKIVIQLWIDDYSNKNQSGLIKYITDNYKGNLPFNKKNAIRIKCYADKENTNELIKFQDMNDIIPNLHPDANMIVGMEGVRVGKVENNKNYYIDNLIIELASIQSSNFIVPNNIISWQVYFTHPELVNMNEYLKHVKELKHSIELTTNNPLRQKHVPVLNEYGEHVLIEEEIILSLIYKFI
tara:strand:- start:9823 stop:10974 length:1152 start_codon:yes stop_codon:yes gene_type:complete